jgi:hypothetical protein
MNFARILASICITFCACLSLRSADPAATRSSIVATTEAPRFAPMPGKVIGVFVTDVKDAMAAEGRTGPTDAVGFASGLGSYRWAYLPCKDTPDDADTISVRVGEPPGKQIRFAEVCVATKPRLMKYGIAAPYTLVELEVNDGLGSSDGDDKFKCSSLRLVEGTEEYSLRVAGVVSSLENQFKIYVKEQEDVITKAMKDLTTEVLGSRPLTGPRETSQHVYVTWLSDRDRPERDCLHVEFRTRVADGDFKYGKGIEHGRFAGKTPAPEQEKRGSRYGTIVGVEFGMIYEISKTGKLQKSEAIPLRTFHREIPPPRMAR